MRNWDHAEVIDLTTAAATAGAASLTTTQISGLTTSSILAITVDGGTPATITTSTVTVAAIKSQIDALPGVFATVNVGGLTATSDVTGLASSVKIEKEATFGTALVASADIATLVPGNLLNIYINDANDAVTITLDGSLVTAQIGTVTAATLAPQLSALTGISAATATNDVAITFDDRGPDPTIRFEGLPVVVTPGLGRVTLASGSGTDADLGHTGDYTGLYVGVAGDVKLDMSRVGSAIVYKAMPVGFHDVAFTRVHGTGTTATNMLGLRKSSDMLCH